MEANDRKQKRYEALLVKHDELIYEVNQLESLFSRTPQQEQRVKELREEMSKVKKEADSLSRGY